MREVLDMKRKAFECVVVPIVMYGAGTCGLMVQKQSNVCFRQISCQSCNVLKIVLSTSA